MLCLAGVTVGFSLPFVSLNEMVGSQAVCVSLIGQIERSVAVIITRQLGSAQGGANFF